METDSPTATVVRRPLTSEQVNKLAELVAQCQKDHQEASAALAGLRQALAEGEGGEPARGCEAVRAFRSIIDREVILHFGFEETELFPALEEAGERAIVSMPLMRQIRREHDAFADLRAEFNVAAEALDDDCKPEEAFASVTPSVRAMSDFLADHIALETEFLSPIEEALREQQAGETEAVGQDA